MDLLEKIRDGKIRGYLTVNKRIIFIGGIYHITQRAPGRELLFLEKVDYLYFLRILKETTKKFSLDLFCFSLLPNHLHLLLRITKENLSQTMKNLFERYADYFNKKYKRKGHVFSGRYRASLCNDERYFLAASIYIHLNAYKAGLCRDFWDYRWSSIGLYIGSFSKGSFVNFKEVLAILDSQIEGARKKYLSLLEESIKIKDNGAMGTSFVKKAIANTERLVKRTIGIKEKRIDNLEEMIRNFQEKKRVVAPEEKEARKYLIVQLLANGYLKQEIAELLSIDRTTLHRILFKCNKTSQT